MGLRSWLSPVTNYVEWREASTLIEENPYSNGICYGISLEKDIPHFKSGEVIIAWSGDGSCLVEELKPAQTNRRTWLLDRYMDEFPEWHTEPGGPTKLGKCFKSETDIKEYWK